MVVDGIESRNEKGVPVVPHRTTKEQPYHESHLARVLFRRSLSFISQRQSSSDRQNVLCFSDGGFDLLSWRRTACRYLPSEYY